MFYIAKGLKTTLHVEPNYLDMLRDKRFVLTQIKQKVEGKYYESVGYVILVREWINDPTCQDVLVEEDGSVSYKVAFEAITFKIEKNEIVDCVVSRCDVQCLYAHIGPIEIAISRGDMPNNFAFQAQNQHYKDLDQEIVIKKGTRLRVQIQQFYFKNGLRGVARLSGTSIIDFCGVLDEEDLRLQQ